MKKYKLLRFGHCYSTKEGDFVIGLVSGYHKHGYTFLASHSTHLMYIERLYIGSRIVPNDGHWIEIDPKHFSAASTGHILGQHFTPAPIADKSYGATPAAIDYWVGHS